MWQAWRANAETTLEEARLLLANSYGRGAVSRAYYAAYDMVTAVLIKLGATLPTRPRHGNWGHNETQRLFWRNIARRRTSKHAQLLGLRISFQQLLEMRRLADYRPDVTINREKVETLVTKAGSIVNLLNELIESGEV